MLPAACIIDRSLETTSLVRVSRCQVSLKSHTGSRRRVIPVPGHVEKDDGGPTSRSCRPQRNPSSSAEARHTTRRGMTSPTQPHEGETILTISASEIHEHDVLCGRGCEISSHPGNIYFRKLVESKNRAYLTCGSKKDKTNIAWSVVDDVHARVPRGRFLIKNETPGRGGRRRRKRPHDETWYEVEDKKAREKAAQALREKAPKIREELNLQKSSSQWNLQKSSSQLNLQKSSSQLNLQKSPSQFNLQKSSSQVNLQKSPSRHWKDQDCHNGGIASQAGNGNLGMMQPQGLVYSEGDGGNKRCKMTELSSPSAETTHFVTPAVEHARSIPPNALNTSPTKSSASMFNNRRYTSNLDTDQLEKRHACPSQGAFVPDTSQLTQLGQCQQGNTPDARYQGEASAAEAIPHSPIRFRQNFQQPQPMTSLHQCYPDEMASQPWHHPSSASANPTAAQDQAYQGGSLTSFGYANSRTAVDTGTHAEGGSIGRPGSFDFETTSVCEGGSFIASLGQQLGHSFEHGDAKAASCGEPPSLNRQLSKTILTRSSFSGDFNMGFCMAPFSPKMPLDRGTGND